MNQSEVAKILAVITELYPGRFKSTEATVMAWWEMLKDEQPEHVLRALRSHAEKSTWPPSIADLLAPIKHMRLEDAPLALPEGRREKWDAVYAAYERGGRKRLEAHSGTSSPERSKFQRLLRGITEDTTGGDAA